MKKQLLLIMSLFLYSLAYAQIQGYSVGDTVDDFTVTTIDGEEINLYTLTASGQYVYIDFFFVDCGPCQATAPHFNELHETYGCNEGDIFCMSMNNGGDDDAYVLTYEEDYGGDYSPCPIVSADGDAGTVNTDFNPAFYPTICLIGPNNVLLNDDIWPISTYQTFVDALVDEGFTPAEMECTVLGVEEESMEASVMLYPNPAKEFIQIEIKGNSVIKNIEIFNTLGNKVLQDITNASASSIKVDISGLNDGFYIANIYDEENNMSAIRFNVIK